VLPVFEQGLATRQKLLPRCATASAQRLFMQGIDFFQGFDDRLQVVIPRISRRADTERRVAEQFLQQIVVCRAKASPPSGHHAMADTPGGLHQQMLFRLAQRRGVITDDDQLPRQHHNVSNMGIEPVELGFGVLAQAQSCLEFN